MSEVLERIRAKIARAEQHIIDLQLALAAFFKTDPYTVADKEDPQRKQRIFYLTKVDPLPVPMEAIASDVIQNLRSPLDQIVYQLALAKGATEAQAKNVKFPVRDLAAHFPSAVGAIAQHAGDRVVDTLRTTEPWQGGKGHALWQLNALRNPEEHHLLCLANTGGVGIDITRHVPEDWLRGATERMTAAWAAMPPVFLQTAHRAPLKVGDELFAIPIDMKMHQQQRFAIGVALYKPGVIECEPLLKTLIDIKNLVSDTVTTLGKFLP